MTLNNMRDVPRSPFDQHRKDHGGRALLWWLVIGSSFAAWLVIGSILVQTL